MPRKSISSLVIDRAAARLEGIKAISETLDLGNGISVTTLQASIEDTRAKEGSYNQQLSVLEEKHAAFEDAEKHLADLSSRVLAAVAAKYGRDSVEYMQAGGVRSRDRKRPARRSKAEIQPQG
jgi:hypothetical protein